MNKKYFCFLDCVTFLYRKGNQMLHDLRKSLSVNKLSSIPVTKRTLSVSFSFLLKNKQKYFLFT